MPEPQSLEEAYAPFAALVRRMGKARAKKAARNLALVALREAWAVVHNEPSDLPYCDQCCYGNEAWAALQARIAALGEREDA